MTHLSPIKSFSIFGLFGSSDVHIPFEDPYKILIGENGLGKTQILNIFYYTITCDFFKLISFDFDKICIETSDALNIDISKKDINEFLYIIHNDINLHNLKDLIGFEDVNTVINTINTPDSFKTNLKRLKEKYKLSINLTLTLYLENLESFDFKKIEHTNLQKFFEKIKTCFSSYKNIYFPTFRRVEEDLHKLGYSNIDQSNQENTTIKFGMTDVANEFTYYETKINDLLKDGFSKISSEILSQLLEDQADDNDFFNNVDERDIAILLARAGNIISEDKKQKIKDIFLNKNTETKDSSLIFILKKLLGIYSEQKELDNAIIKFRDVCNTYLINKKVFYDESAIKIYIKLNGTGNELPLNKLSSGEKQIISMFAKIYLAEPEQRFLILFDEPELSLSVNWQRQLLPDIVNSGKCDFLLAVTHSPFIFDNALDQYAIGLNEYISPTSES